MAPLPDPGEACEKQRGAREHGAVEGEHFARAVEVAAGEEVDAERVEERADEEGEGGAEFVIAGM
jgi:hypothetical protein